MARKNFFPCSLISRRDKFPRRTTPHSDSKYSWLDRFKVVNPPAVQQSLLIRIRKPKLRNRMVHDTQYNPPTSLVKFFIIVYMHNLTKLVGSNHAATVQTYYTLRTYIQNKQYKENLSTDARKSCLWKAQKHR